MPRTLFEIGAELQALNDLLDDIGGDVSDPAVEDRVTQWFEELSRDEAVKLDHYCGLIKMLDGEVAVLKSEADEYAKRAKSRENRIANLKARMKLHLEATGRTRAVTATGRTVCVQKNGGKPPVECDPVPLDDLPPAFVRVTRAIDADAVRAALGQVLASARFGGFGTHLRIR